MNKKGFININNAEIYYEVAGEGEPLILLHGVPLDSRMWEPQMNALSKLNFQVIRFDIRGLGKTIDPGLPFALYDDIHALLQKLDIQCAYCVGVSFGCYASVEFALAYPDMVKGLILACPGGFTPTSEDRQLLLNNLYEELSSGNIEKALDINLHLFLDGPNQKIGRVQLTREWLKEIYRDIFSKSANPIKPTWLEPHPSERLAEVKVPTLVVSGELDHPDFIHTANILVTNIPNATHLTLKKSAHFPNIDSPNEFNEIVVSFLKNN
ncbi:alpha/beta fold hydrolase [Paenibacillus pectinilyticus]|uniref:alpha/beta fold hydrolase n=1 Tax=Paenibacillus pectinilyticus TaxID=512399 RepID=UPI001428A06B|nr:alpha/beta hydrolase [Paenibacillus pectinilyticus]